MVKLNVDLSKLSKPMEKLIDSVERGMGRFYEPWHIKRAAKAVVKAERVLTGAKEETRDLYFRAVNRSAYQEVRRQRNFDTVVQKAIDELPEEVNEEPVEEDWMDISLNRLRTSATKKCKTYGLNCSPEKLPNLELIP